MKIKELQKILKNEEMFLVTSEVSRFYLTGFHSSDGYLCISKNKACFFTDSRYIENAEKSITLCDTALFNGFDCIENFTEKNSVQKVFVESDRVTLSEFEKYKMLLKNCEVLSDGVLDKAINSIREIKSQSEKENILKAQRIAEKAFDDVLGFISTDVTEKDVAAFIEYSMRRHGGEGVSFDTIVVSGKNSSMPHGVPSDKKFEKGDFITMDFGCIFDGYRSDMTRTVAIGSVTAKQREVYSVVLDAQEKAISVIREGMGCSAADKVSRDIIEKAGYGKYFGHSLGHGVGIEIHESPTLSPRSDSILKENNIVTVEPGIYIPDEFGVRIEDFGAVTKNGFDNFTKTTKELIIL